MTAAAPRGLLSLSARVVINAEAMNMVEAIGNVVRHRKATLVYRLREGQNERYEIRTVPVISGEALRHAIQVALAEIAEKMGLPVCEWCKRGELVKHGVRLDDFFKFKFKDEDREVEVKNVDDFKKSASESIYRAEWLVVGSCVVEDVCGFLIPTETPVKRTSVLEVGYMVPAVEGGRVIYGFDVQFHVRHAPGAQRVVEQKQHREEQAQSVYNVESSSAVYAMSLNVELWRVGTYFAEKDGRLELRALGDRAKRVRAALLALVAVLNGDVRVGGHWSSYRPLWRLESAAAVFSSPMPVSAAPAVDEKYLKETVELARAKAGVYRGALGEGAVSYRVLVLEGPTRKLETKLDKDVEVVGSASDFVKRLVELGLEYAGAK
jgi:CRISPR-associated protein Csa2